MCAKASLPVTAPTAPGVSGSIGWSWALSAACIALSGSCKRLASLWPGEPIHQQAVPGLAQGTWHHLPHEPCGRGVGQLGHGELLQFNEDGTHCQEGLPQPRAGPGGCVRLHRALLQPQAPTFDVGLRQSDTVRESSRSLGWCPRNRQQPILHAEPASTQVGAPNPTRTGTPCWRRRILSPLCLPISPSGHAHGSVPARPGCLIGAPTVRRGKTESWPVRGEKLTCVQKVLYSSVLR
jgi:hypothetical protein